MDASLFLTEVDIHHPKPLLDENLRAYIVQHSLFFEKCLVGDSQFNNNPNFRKLIWDKEANTQPVSYPQDLWELSEKGFLIPAVRNEYGSLTALRKDHASRHVEHLPTEAYVTLMDEKLGDKMETYNIRDVSIAFRERVLEALDSQDNVGRGKISKKTSLLMRNYVERQDPLLFDSFRKWMRVQIENGNMTERDYYLVDRLTAGAYRHNVAIALNKNLDIPASHSRDIYPITITLGSTGNILPGMRSKKIDIKSTMVLSSKVLSQIPAEALIEIKTNGMYFVKVVNALEKFRLNNSINMEEFGELLENYFSEVQYVFLNTIPSKHQAALRRIKNEEVAKLILKNSPDIGLSILAFVPFAQPIALVLNSFGFINAASGTISDIRSLTKNADAIGKRSFILGRSNSLEKLYVIKK
ncbi:MAG: hypothetical protein HY781_07640 [Chloroflexi bacterium]|nr:hypothetical protein [Chloroflexota bacterium]